MARKYGYTAGQSTAASATETSISITAPSTMIVQVNRQRVSQQTHKTSEQYGMFGQRASAAGTATAVTANAEKEVGGPDFSSTVGVNHTVEPTYTANQFNWGDDNWNSLTGRDIVYPPGEESFLAPSGIVGFAVNTPSATTTFTPKHRVEWSEIG